MDKKRDPLATAVIAALGGPSATARIFGIKAPSVMAWYETGIPPARVMYLDVAYPEIMRNARKVKTEQMIDRVAASDDSQPPVGGTVRKNRKN
jgi:hypothetical protein